MVWLSVSQGVGVDPVLVIITNHVGTNKQYWLSDPTNNDSSGDRLERACATCPNLGRFMFFVVSFHIFLPKNTPPLPRKNITKIILPEHLYSPGAPSEARRWIFLIFGREILREIWREFCGIFSDPQNKGSKNRGKLRSIFREKIRASKKIFRANFVLQMCHPKSLCNFARGQLQNNYVMSTKLVAQELFCVIGGLQRPRTLPCWATRNLRNSRENHSQILFCGVIDYAKLSQSPRK